MFLANNKNRKEKSAPFVNCDGSLQRHKQKQSDAVQTPELSGVSMAQIHGQNRMGNLLT